MSQLAKMAGKTAEEFNKAIAELEEMSGFPSEDVRHLAESTQKLRDKISSLGLDPDDTTGQELYYALQARYAQDAVSLDRAAGITTGSNLPERAHKAAQLVGHAVKAEDSWVLKNSVAKKIVKQNAPKKLMKALHYRSVDSLIKHQDIGAIFIAANALEAATWRKKIESQIAKLNSSNYELRQPKIVALPDRLAAHLDKQPILLDFVTATVAISPNAKPATPILTLALSLIDSLEKLNENHLAHKLHACHPALAWWQDTEHLQFAHDGQLVSLNFKDVGLNHFMAKEYQDHERQNAQQSFWAGLMERYRKYVDELPQAVAEVDQALARSFNPAKDLAMEMIEV